MGSRGHRPQPGALVMSKILLAEDDIDMRRFLVRALQNAGFEVISYDNGLAAYQRLREEPFELLLTDIVMPEMDGIELARRAAELDPDIKIMFITGFAAVALNSVSSASFEAAKVASAWPFKSTISSATDRELSAADWALAKIPAVAADCCPIPVEISVAKALRFLIAAIMWLMVETTAAQVSRTAAILRAISSVARPL